MGTRVKALRLRAIDLAQARDGGRVRVAGMVTPN
jgi:hypothetical protein